ncbi:MAG: VWA-like domain-containing protein [Bacteroidota bacterium]
MLLARQPFYARLLASLVKVEVPNLGLPTLLLWVNGKPVLHHDRVLLQAISSWPEWYADWLEEALLHLVLGHHLLCNNSENRNAASIAADLEVWQFHSRREAQAAYQQLCTRLRLPPSFDFHAAYKAVVQLQQASGKADALPGLNMLPLSRRAHHYWNKHPIDGQDFLLWRSSLQPVISQNVSTTKTPWSTLINRISANENAWQLPWPVLLRRFALTAQRDQVFSSLRRPSKRYQNFPGTRRHRRARLAVILDTSGSINHDLRLQFFQELRVLLPLVHQIDLLEADNQVRKTYSFTGEIPTHSSGGGATRFDPALAQVNQAKHYDGIIYFTDGEGPVPTVHPRFPLLWLITNGEDAPRHLAQFPGRVIRLRS